MRRSSSVSQIPKPKTDLKARAKPSARTGIRDATGSAKKSRPGSVDRLTAPGLKRSSSFTNFRPSNLLATAPKASNIKKLSTGITTPVNAPGLLRSNSNLATPASSRSRSRSPFKISSERTNKKWVTEQYLKVQEFLRQSTDCHDHISEIIKPPTINTFVYVMNILLKEINPKIELNMTNYKDIVFSTLKTLQYPGNISNSLLKTVNTMHTWPQVISIFGWVVDLVSVVRRVNASVSYVGESEPKRQKAECVIDYIFKRYFSYNNEGAENQEVREVLDREFAETFARILNIDEREIEELRCEIDKLSVLKEKQLKQIGEQNIKNDTLKNETDALQNEMNSFYENKELKREDLNCEIEMLKGRREKLTESIRAKRDDLVALSEVVKTQSCSVEEKKRMLKHIEEMKHTIDLKREKMKLQKLLKVECEEKLTEARKKVETEVYRLNNTLMKLVMLEPKLKMLHLKEVDLLSEEYANDIQVLSKNIEMFEGEFKNEITQQKSLLSKTKKDISALEFKVRTVKEQVEIVNESEKSLITEIEKLNEEIENMSKKREEQRKEFAEKMEKIEECAPNVEKLRQRLRNISETKTRKQMEFDDHQEKSLEFFEILRNVIMDNLAEMNKIRTGIFDFLEECLRKIDEKQNEISADLKELDELRE